MLCFLRTLTRPLLFMTLVVMLVVGGLLLPTAHAGAGDDRPVIVVPADVYRPAGTEIPVLWKVRPGSVTFYSSQSDPEYATGTYLIDPEDIVHYDPQGVSMYDAPVYRMKCGRRHEFTASPTESLYPETYRIYIPCAGVTAAVKKVTVKAKSVRVHGTVRPVSKVKRVRVAIYRHGKRVTRAKSAPLKTSWKVTFKKKLRKGTYVAKVRVTAKDGKVKVVKCRIVVR